MSKFLTVILSLAFATFASLSFANMMGTKANNTMNTNNKTVKQTSLSANWICTTNASSSDVDADKNADKTMSEKKQSISEAFSFASKHCRDCTKITCEYQENKMF